MRGVYSSGDADYGKGFDGGESAPVNDDFTSEQESREWAPVIEASYSPDWGVGIEEFNVIEFGCEQGLGRPLGSPMGDFWDDIVGQLETGVEQATQGLIQQGVNALTPEEQVSYNPPPTGSQIVGYDQYNRPIYSQTPPKSSLKDWMPVIYGGMGVAAFLITLSMVVKRK